MPSHDPAAATVLALVVRPETVRRFLGLFTAGVSLPITTGSTLQATVCEQLGVSEAYFEDRIQTIFLNYKAVDAPEKARIEDGAIIALSAAMPGLVGATMRRAGTYAALRSSISFRETGGAVQAREGRITLKLLNMVGRELGPAFLANGVYLTGEQLADLFAGGPDLKDGCREVRLDGAAVDWEQLGAQDWSGRRVLLKVRSA